MKKLSPAAQTVLDATGTTGTPLELAARGIAAAALRAAADRVVPETPSLIYPDDYESGAYEANQWARFRLLAIVDELENA